MHKAKTILNESTGEYTNPNRARRLVKKGMAVWTGDESIMFIDRDPPLDLFGGIDCPILHTAKWQSCYRTTDSVTLAPWPGWTLKLKTKAPKLSTLNAHGFR